MRKELIEGVYGCDVEVVLPSDAFHESVSQSSVTFLPPLEQSYGHKSLPPFPVMDLLTGRFSSQIQILELISVAHSTLSGRPHRRSVISGILSTTILFLVQTALFNVLLALNLPFPYRYCISLLTLWDSFMRGDCN